MGDIRIGTSSFTAAGRNGTFYPKRLKPADYLSYYAQHFDTVEVDSTFYPTPNVNVVRSWGCLLKKVQERRIMILAFANNHYAGYGPGTVDLFRRIWGMEAPRVVHHPQQTARQHSLFD